MLNQTIDIESVMATIQQDINQDTPFLLDTLSNGSFNDNDWKPNKNECLLISLKMTGTIDLLTSSRLSQIIFTGELFSLTLL